MLRKTHRLLPDNSLERIQSIVPSINGLSFCVVLNNGRAQIFETSSLKSLFNIENIQQVFALSGGVFLLTNFKGKVFKVDVFQKRVGTHAHLLFPLHEIEKHCENMEESKLQKTSLEYIDLVKAEVLNNKCFVARSTLCPQKFSALEYSDAELLQMAEENNVIGIFNQETLNTITLKPLLSRIDSFTVLPIINKIAVAYSNERSELIGIYEENGKLIDTLKSNWGYFDDFLCYKHASRGNLIALSHSSLLNVRINPRNESVLNIQLWSRFNSYVDFTFSSTHPVYDFFVTYNHKPLVIDENTLATYNPYKNTILTLDLKKWEIHAQPMHNYTSPLYNYVFMPETFLAKKKIILFGEHELDVAPFPRSPSSFRVSESKESLWNKPKPETNHYNSSILNYVFNSLDPPSPD